MKSWSFPSVLDAQIAEEEGEKTGRQSFQQFFGGHGILTTFILSKRHTAGAHSCSCTVLLSNTFAGAINTVPAMHWLSSTGLGLTQKGQNPS